MLIPGPLKWLTFILLYIIVIVLYIIVIFLCIIITAENELADMKEQHAQEIAKLKSEHKSGIESKEHSLSLQLDKLTQDADIGKLHCSSIPFVNSKN